ncbi:iduronate-2-sulfatase [Haloferula helveola]|uniref:Iduronate-2-sulfatase n=1 Tax=Haloferula helveola TaxID=490095 RepID=A0ABN6H6U3_9BACT|nr:iduronate-2-sulfatase [Haloferula helveola]
MRRLLFLTTLALSVARAADRPNVLLICVDDLRPELACYGVDYIHSPNIDKLAEAGRLFERHYVQAPTCGASRYTLLTGRYDRKNGGNGALFARAGKLEDPPVHPSLPRFLLDHGYQTVSVGKVSHHPGGRGGSDWDDDTKHEMPGAWSRHLQPTGPWKHPRGIMHGLAHGEIRVKAGDMDLYQAEEGGDEIYPDGLITNTALGELKTLAEDDRPFFLAVGIIRPHLPFGAPKKYLDLYKDTELPPILHPEKPEGKTTWHGSGEFMKYNRWGKDPRKDNDFATEVRRHYAACVSYADAQVGRLMAALEATGELDNTIVLLWGDHGWHLGEHAIWGKHALFEESLRSPLIIRYPDIPQPGKKASGVVETVDIFATLCDLTGLEAPEGLDSRSLMPLIKDPAAEGEAALSYHGGASTLRNDRYRLIAHKNGHSELYDHQADGSETKNLAEKHPDVVKEMRATIKARMKP